MKKVIIKTSLFIMPDVINTDSLISAGKTLFTNTYPSKIIFQTFYKSTNRSVGWKREIWKKFKLWLMHY